jgi:cytochrome c-type biogenesis protein CcmE
MESVLRPRLARTTPRARFGSIKFLLGGLLILGAMGYVSFTSFQSNTVYYYTLREFQAQQAQLRGQTVRVNGPLDQSSIDLDQKTMTLKFNLKEQDVILPVVYRGVVPDT